MSFFESFEPMFNTYVLGNAPVKQIASGFDWVEGPVWFGDVGCLLFSDIPNNKIMRWTPDGAVSVFREPSNYANGHTRDRQGRLISCEHGTRRVTRTELDGTITVLTESINGARLNSPNDVVVKSDGTIWSTDPHYGIKGSRPITRVSSLSRNFPAMSIALIRRTARWTLLSRTFTVPTDSPLVR